MLLSTFAVDCNARESSLAPLELAAHKETANVLAPS